MSFIGLLVSAVNDWHRQGVAFGCSQLLFSRCRKRFQMSIYVSRGIVPLGNR